MREQLLVVSIDGVAPRSVTPTTMPTLCALARQGAACFRSSTVEPPLTLPAHASMLRGTEPAGHGLFDNTAARPECDAPSFLKVARDAGLRTAWFVSWRNFESIVEGDAATVRLLLDSGYERTDDAVLVRAAIEQMRSDAPDLAFVYLSEVDLVAHESGWDSRPYIDALGRADDLLAALVSRMGSDTAILVTTDHGGEGLSHREAIPANMDTFVVVRSARVEPGSTIPDCSILDIAPTVADLCGFEPAPEWVGASVLGTEEPLIDHLMSLLESLADHEYGERVSMLAHSLQTAALARELAPGDDRLALAALMHDVGHLLGDAGEWGLADHAEVGARYLQPWFQEAVVEPIRLHVAAKRWLVREERAYLDQLSAASRVTLEQQGGPFTAAEAADFLLEPHAESALALRRCDDSGKDPDREIDDLREYREVLERALAETAHEVPAVWARDSCRCPECRDPSSGQHLIDFEDLLGWRAEGSSRDGGDLVVRLVSDDGEVHRCLIPETPQAPADLPQRQWRAELQLPSHGAEGVDLTELARDISSFGIAVVAGAPCRDGEVLSFARQIGYVRETNYGALFDVVDKRDANNLAYTALGLPLHTDNPYREPVPTVQLLHCISAPDSGGESRFSDGFAAATELRLDAPTEFETLCRTPVEFRFFDRANSVDLRAQRPVIELGPTGEVLAVNVNHRSMEAAPAPDWSTTRFYSAYERFRRLLESPDSVVEHTLRPGELVIFDNRRVLHGRGAFQRGSGRHLQGCYIDIDAIRSLARASS